MNMEFWDKMKTPPEKALKEIQGGRLKGKTDINPEWRYQVMTEVFGPCGVGWQEQILKLWTEEGTDGQKMAFAHINLYIKINDKWSKAIPGIGGSMAIAQENEGLHTSDECYKMAETDALSVAMKKIGVAADIYLGFHESKYAERKDNHGESKFLKQSWNIPKENKNIYDILREAKKAYYKKENDSWILYLAEDLCKDNFKVLLEKFPELKGSAK